MAEMRIGDNVIQLKAVKKTCGMEGYGFTANIYINKKKIGTYADYGDGAMGNCLFDSEDIEKQFRLLIVEYAEKRPNKYIVDMYEKEPDKYKVAMERTKKIFPYIPEEKLTMNVISSLEFDYIMEELYNLIEDEKEFKKVLKKGYGYLAYSEHKNSSIMYPANWTEDQVRADMKEEGLVILYKSLNDFIITI